MSQYTVTATFDNVDEALRFLSHGDGNRQPIGATVERTDVKAAPAPAKPKAEKPAPVVAAAASAPAPPVSAPAASALPSTDYPTLQKAVFKLAGLSREVVGEVAASFEVKTFKDLAPALWGDALAAVNAAIATQEEAVPA